MSDLISSVIAAHGGLDRWRTVRAIDVTFNFSGGLLDLNGYPGHRRPSASVDAATPRTVFQKLGDESDERWTFTPNLVWIERRDGTIVEERSDPRRLPPRPLPSNPPHAIGVRAAAPAKFETEIKRRISHGVARTRLSLVSPKMQIRPICADFRRTQQRISGIEDCVADDAVWSEPVSGRNSLLNRENTGNFLALRHFSGDRYCKNLLNLRSYREIPYSQ
jgi:hypothetical protein